MSLRADQRREDATEKEGKRRFRRPALRQSFGAWRIGH